MLSLAYERYPTDICFTVLPKTLIQIYTDNNEDKSLVENEDADSSEVRYLPHLRKNVIKISLENSLYLHRLNRFL